MDQVKETTLKLKMRPLEESDPFGEKLKTKTNAEVLEGMKSTVGVASGTFLGQESFTFSHEFKINAALRFFLHIHSYSMQLKNV